MIPMGSADTALEMLKAFRDMKTILENADSLDHVIGGVAQAKETIAQAADIAAQIDKAEALALSNAAETAKIAELHQQLNDAMGLIEQRQTAITDREGLVAPKFAEIAKKQDELLQYEAALYRRETVIAEREATIRADLDAAAQQKQIYTDKVKVLSTLTGDQA